jgi:hypothetical protein
MIKSFHYRSNTIYTLQSQTFSQSADTTQSVKKALPAFLKGTFEDDYGITYTINDTLWLQHPGAKYHIIACDTTEQYLLIQNDKANRSGGGLFTRIDYMIFTGMEPYQWAFV